MKSLLFSELKRNIRESLVYALFVNDVDNLKPSLVRNIINDFYASLNRKLCLLNYEANEEIKKAIEQYEKWLE